MVRQTMTPAADAKDLNTMSSFLDSTGLLKRMAERRPSLLPAPER
jgi:hypothetical protein